MARLSFALPILDRCERPRTASVRAWRLQPGRLAQGPDEKCGIAGRTPGGLLISPILPDRMPLVGEGCPAAGLKEGSGWRQAWKNISRTGSAHRRGLPAQSG